MHAIDDGAWRHVGRIAHGIACPFKSFSACTPLHGMNRVHLPANPASCSRFSGDCGPTSMIAFCRYMYMYSTSVKLPQYEICCFFFHSNTLSFQKFCRMMNDHRRLSALPVSSFNRVTHAHGRSRPLPLSRPLRSFCSIEATLSQPGL